MPLLHGSVAVISVRGPSTAAPSSIQTNRPMRQPKMARIAPYKGTTCNSPATALRSCDRNVVGNLIVVGFKQPYRLQCLTFTVLLVQLYLHTWTDSREKYAALKPASKRLVDQIAIDLKLTDIGSLDALRALFFAGFDDRAALEIHNFVCSHNVGASDKLPTTRSKLALSVFASQFDLLAYLRIFVRRTWHVLRIRVLARSAALALAK